MVSQTEHLTQVYEVRFPKITTQCSCPFSVCAGSSWTWNVLWKYFNLQYWEDNIIILQKHPYPFPKCDHCGSMVPPWQLNICHYKSGKFQIREEIRIQGETLQHCFEESWVSIRIDAEPLEPVGAFPYLGHTTTYNNSNWAAVHHNLLNAQRCWWIISKVMPKMGATARDRGMLYKAVMQTVLLYRIKRWVTTGAMLKVLEVLNHRVVWRIMRMTAWHTAYCVRRVGVPPSG